MKDLNSKLLFWASFLTLIAAGMGFSIRSDIMAVWGKEFHFTQTQLGEITGMGLFGFGLTIIFFSFFADAVGYGRLMVIAFLLHAAAVVTTLAAPYAVKAGMGDTGAYWCLYVGQLCFSLANGTCEAVINPLTASLFPKNKTHWLNILHAGWPGGLVLGVLVSMGLDEIGARTGVQIGWMVRWGIVMAPVLIYGLMMVGRPFPHSEAKEHGISITAMMAEIGMLGAAVAIGLLGLWMSKDVAPTFGLPNWAGWIPAGILWIVFGGFCGFRFGYVLLAGLYALHALVGYVELGTDNWIIDIAKTVLSDRTTALLAFLWTNVLMFTLRFFAGPIVHRISPAGLLFGSAVLGTIGLLVLGLPFTNTALLWFGAVTIYALGKTFYWPTMLGVISERFPKGGALALGFSGGVGMLSAGILGGPMIGYSQDYAATHKLQELDAEKKTEALARYKAAKPVAAPVPGLPAIAGLDNAKVGVLNDDGKQLKEDMELLSKSGETVTAEERYDLKKQVDAWATDGQLTVESYTTMLTAFKKLSANKDVKILDLWWKNEGEPHAKGDPTVRAAAPIGGAVVFATANTFPADKDLVREATLHGDRQALTWTAGVPAIMAVGYLLLILYFRFTGGYKQVHIDEEPKVPDAGGYAPMPPPKQTLEGHDEGYTEGIPGESVESTPL
jgi:MFS family permease